MRAALTRNLLLYVTARVLVAVAVQIQSVALGWFVYSQTGSALSLALIGLAQFLPAIPTLGFAGYAADHYNRRKVIMTAQSCQALCLALLALTIWFQPSWIVLVYVLVILVSATRQTAVPSLVSILPTAVPREEYPRAIAIASAAMQFAMSVGPAVGGFGYAFLDKGIFFVLPFLPLAALTVVSLIRLPKQAIDKPSGSPIQRSLMGLAYIRSNRLLLGLILLDLFAVLFGGVTALLPIFAHDVLHVGPQGLGMLGSAAAVGAVLIGVVLAYVPVQRRAGPMMLTAVATYGVAIVAFGFSKSFFLSLACLVVSGMCDMVGTVIRQTIIQTATPDAMRGRVSAVNMVFVGAGNQLGNAESGAVAWLIGAVPAAIVGGLGTLVVVLSAFLLFPEIRRTDRIPSYHPPPEPRKKDGKDSKADDGAGPTPRVVAN